MVAIMRLRLDICNEDEALAVKKIGKRSFMATFIFQIWQIKKLLEKFIKNTLLDYLDKLHKIFKRIEGRIS